MKLALAILLFLNLRTYYLMYADKRNAKRGEWRTPEARLHLNGFLLGSVGIIAAMLPPISHKGRKAKFVVIAWLCLLSNIMFLYLVYDFWAANRL